MTLYTGIEAAIEKFEADVGVSEQDYTRNRAHVAFVRGWEHGRIGDFTGEEVVDRLIRDADDIAAIKAGYRAGRV